MPNWSENWVTIKGDEKTLREIVDYVGSEDQAFDFEKIVPRPEELLVTAGGSEIKSVLYYITGCLATPVDKLPEEKKRLLELVSWNEWQQTEEELAAESMNPRKEKALINDGIKYVRNLKRYGAADWYDWSCKNWGTKWNASDVSMSGNPEDGEITFSFSTAWAPPDPVYEALSKKFPETLFETAAEIEGDDFVIYHADFLDGDCREWQEEDAEAREEYEEEMKMEEESS